ncbi:hypothetical protein AAGG43_09705 [Bacillus paranthracis]|nr:hypothetical protein [Bacillus cereus]
MSGLTYFMICIVIVVACICNGVKNSNERERLLDEKIRRGIK